jgi:hypothetical protein
MDTQFNWKSFVYNISNRAMIPVIGNDLSFIRLQKHKVAQWENHAAIYANGQDEGETIRINLYKYLAIRLWDIFAKGLIPIKPSVNNVVLELIENNIPENDILLAIRNEINLLTADEILLEPYLKLIAIKGFDTFVSVNYDNFLERAFEIANKHVNPSVNFLIPFPANNPDARRDPALPMIYNLMGNIEGYGFAVTDEQSLEYMYMLQNGIETIAKDLFTAISRKNILLVGSSFPDWFMRFFIRIISNERFKNSMKAKYVACDSTLHDKELKLFLEHNATKIIPITDQTTDIGKDSQIYKNSIEFIEQMYEQCTQGGVSERNKVQFKENIFISYSWSDKELASRIKNEFEHNGLNVFFDDDELKTGDRYNQVIKKYLKECDYFVALISENSISDQSRYVYDKEWKFAIFFDDERNYIRPYIIDETVPTDPRIPEEMRNLNIEKIQSFDQLGPVIRKFIAENKLTPITT